MNAIRKDLEKSSVTDLIGKLSIWILILLEHEGPLSFAALVRELQVVSSSEVGLAVGWLARENSLVVVKDQDVIRIALHPARATQKEIS